MGFGEMGLGLRVWVVGSGVWDLGMGVCELGSGVWGFRFEVWGLGFMIYGLGFRGRGKEAERFGVEVLGVSGVGRRESTQGSSWGYLKVNSSRDLVNCWR